MPSVSLKRCIELRRRQKSINAATEGHKKAMSRKQREFNSTMERLLAKERQYEAMQQEVTDAYSALYDQEEKEKMRKREAEKVIAGLKAEIVALNAKIAVLAATSTPQPVVTQKPRSKSVFKKAAKKVEPEPATTAPVVIPGAAEAGSPGYDDLVTPINDHDYNWNADQAKEDG